MKKNHTAEQINIFWQHIESFKWSSDNNWKRVCLEFSLMHSKSRTRLAAFVEELYEALDKKYGEANLGVSDDSWSDLRAEVIGRGRKFYESISVKKLQQMAKDMDYYENFKYGFQIMEPITVFQQYRELLITVQHMERHQEAYTKQSEYHRLMYQYHLQLEIMRETLIAK